MVNFPNKLFQLLQAADTEGFQDIISWDTVGNSFEIHQPEEFTKVILPRFFPSQSSLRSFERMLNIWGFERRVKRKKIYFHTCFWKKRPEILRFIQRVENKGTRQKLAGGGSIRLDIPEWAQQQQLAALHFLEQKEEGGIKSKAKADQSKISNDILSSMKEQFFNKYFQELREFVSTHGHCNITDTHFLHRYNPPLQIWVSDQRRFKANGTIDKLHEARLDAIGFVWDEPPTLSNEPLTAPSSTLS